jgi:hypothetical protein
MLGAPPTATPGESVGESDGLVHFEWTSASVLLIISSVVERPEKSVSSDEADDPGLSEPDGADVENVCDSVRGDVRPDGTCHSLSVAEVGNSTSVEELSDSVSVGGSSDGHMEVLNDSSPLEEDGAAAEDDAEAVSTSSG